MKNATNMIDKHAIRLQKYFFITWLNNRELTLICTNKAYNVFYPDSNFESILDQVTWNWLLKKGPLLSSNFIQMSAHFCGLPQKWTGICMKLDDRRPFFES